MYKNLIEIDVSNFNIEDIGDGFNVKIIDSEFDLILNLILFLLSLFFITFTIMI